MPISEVLGLTALNGLIAQLVALGVIVASFVLLRRFAPLEGAVAVWAGAWTAAFVALLAILLRFLLLPSLSVEALPSQTAPSNALDFVYQAGKLLSAALLLLGARMVRGRRPGRGTLLGAGLLLLAYAGATVARTAAPHGLVLWQSPVVVGLLAATAVVLVRREEGREPPPGARTAAGAAGAVALLWLLYLFSFRAAAPSGPLGEALQLVTRFNSYFDLFGHLALAFALAQLAARGVHDRLVLLHGDLERAHERLRSAMRYDELTGVYNRRAFEELAHRHGWHTRPLTVAMLDMDNLKQINDEQGHAAGDAALAHLASHLQRAVGSDGAVFRWGGDEFLVVSTRSGDDRLRDRLEATLRQIGAVPGLDALPVEVSLGTARREHDEPLGRLIGQADQAMYRHKATRRGQGVEQPGLWDHLREPRR